MGKITLITLQTKSPSLQKGTGYFIFVASRDLDALDPGNHKNNLFPLTHHPRRIRNGHEVEFLEGFVYWLTLGALLRFLSCIFKLEFSLFSDLICSICSLCKLSSRFVLWPQDGCC